MKTRVPYRTRLGTLQQQLHRKPAALPWVVRRALAPAALAHIVTHPDFGDAFYFPLLDKVVALTKQVRTLRIKLHTARARRRR